MGSRLPAVLEEAKERGFLGPGPIEDHIEQAGAFVAAADTAPARWLDLGSGGGVPGLVLAGAWPDTEFVLLDSQLRRVRFLLTAVEALGLGDRGAVEHARAEDAGRDRRWRGQFDLVASRSFGPPAVTAECGVPFLRVGGALLVAEPRDSPDERWPAAPLEELALADEGAVRAGRATVRRLVTTAACPDRFPRRPGVPARRPLFAPS